MSSERSEDRLAREKGICGIDEIAFNATITSYVQHPTFTSPPPHPIFFPFPITIIVATFLPVCEGQGGKDNFYSMICSIFKRNSDTP